MKGINSLFLLVLLTSISACSGGSTTSPSGEVSNNPPVASAGQDISQIETLLVTLSGSESTDTDGTISSYLWRQISGTQVSLSDSDKATATFTAPSTDTSLTLEFELSVTDNMGASSTDKVLVTVIPNAPPTASAGQDKTQTETLLVTLSGSESTDTDGTISSYLWRQISGTHVSLSDSDKATATFTAPLTNTKVTLEFELQVTDNLGASSTDKVLVTVIPSSSPSVVTIDLPISGSRFFGDRITVSGTASKQGGIDWTSVNVKVGNSNVSAQVDADGNWRAENVPLPTNLSNIVIRAIATDKVGETREAQVTIENIPTLTRPLFSFNPQRPNILYAIEDIGISYDRIIAIDLDTMQRQLLFPSNSPLGANGLNMGQLISVDFDSLNNQIVLADWQNSIHTFNTSNNLLTTFKLSDKNLGENSNPYGVVVDSENNRALFVNFDPALVSVDLSKGDSTIISDNSDVGTGEVTFRFPKQVALESANNRALVYDSGLYAILAVNLSTGKRSVIADSENGTGDLLTNIRSLKLDSDKLIGLQSGDLIEINLENGNRTKISDNAGESIQAGSSTQMLVDNINNRYLINDFSTNPYSNDTDSIIAVDKSTKERSIVFKEMVSSGPQMDGLTAMAIDPVRNIGYILDFYSQSIYVVNLLTGKRQLFSSSGIELDRPIDIEIDRNNNQLLIADLGLKGIVAIDLDTGVRSILSNNSDGGSPQYDKPRHIAYSEETGTLYIADVGLNAVIAVDINTGNRVILSDANTGEGFNSDTKMSAIAVSKNGSAVYVGDQGNGSALTQALISIDTNTGDRQIVSDYTTGEGTKINAINSIHILSDNNQALIADFEVTKLVNLSTGDRTVLADNVSVGNGEPFLNIREVTMGGNENIIYVLSINYEAIFAIDRFTGDRVIISK